MQTTPKGLRLQIGIFGRTNVGKSSFLNLISQQETAITSPHPGTTTDVVEKTMELLPIGPIVLLDTAGLDDISALGKARIEKTKNIFDRTDIILLVCESEVWTEFEQLVVTESIQRKTPLIIAINKADLKTPSTEYLAKINKYTANLITVSSIDKAQAESAINSFKAAIIQACPDDFLNPPPLVSDLISAGDTVICIVPIDLQAPKGRLILPQVQTIREILDSDATALVVKEREYAPTLNNLKTPPSLVICDSQVVLKMVADTPATIPCTTFSTLFARNKGDLSTAVAGAKCIDKLKPGDKVLIAEACSHHALEDDIGRIKIPRWLRQYVGVEVQIDVVCGHDYPKNIQEYALIIHCGSCMINRRETLSRYQKAVALNIPITNYGVCISFLQGVLDRIIAPFNL